MLHMNVFSGNSCGFFFSCQCMSVDCTQRNKTIETGGNKKNQNMHTGAQELQRKREELCVKKQTNK